MDQPPAEQLLDAALHYASAGLKIYPVLIPGLKPDGKKDVRVPVLWKTAATSDLEQVKRWWAEDFPGYGIGVDMGASRLAVADADVKDGVDGIARLNHALTDTPAAPASHTPSGGVHVWYRDPDGEMGSGANIFGTKDEPSGVDGRGVGGTIFLPPTYVPGYGQYRWANDTPPDFAGLPRVPEVLAKACPPGGKKKQSNPSPGMPGIARATPGITHSQLFGSPAVTPVDRMLSIEEAKTRLMPLWEEVRDTKSPNGLWQAVANFARAAAHYQCYWDRAWVEQMVLYAYAEGGHGYAVLDADDHRAIESAYALQDQARSAGDLDEGWQANPLMPEPASADEVDALLAEMRSPAQIKEQPPRKYLIKGLINLDSETWIIGEPGSRKSFVVLDMAAHVALGKDWQGRKVTQGNVVIISAEGNGSLGSRIKAWEAEYGQEMPEGVYVLPRPVQAANAHAWDVLVQACKRLAAVYVVLDTQARVTVGLKENDATDMGVFINAVAAIRSATGGAIAPVHHTGRNGGDARGSSALDGAQDTELKVVSLPAPLRGELRVEKQKDLIEGPPIPLTFRIHTVGVDEDGDPITSLALAPQQPWDAAGVDAEDIVEPGQEANVPEPEPWTWVPAEHPRQHTLRRVLQVLATVAGEVGVTESAVQRVVRARWHNGNPLRPKKTGHLDPQTWERAWTAARALETASGEPVVVKPDEHAARFAVNQVALSELVRAAKDLGTKVGT